MKALFDRPLLLDNGLLLMLNHSDLPEEISIGARVLMGSFDEMLERDIGICHLISHTVWCGTDDYDGETLRNLLASKGLEASSEMGRTYSSYSARCHPERFSEALDVLDSVIFRPTLNAEAANVGRELAMDRIERDRADALSQATMKCLAATYPEHRVANNPLGSIDTLKSIRVTRMREFVRGFHRPQTMLLSISGKLPNYEDLESILDEHASAFVRKTRAANQDPLPRNWGDPAINDEETHEEEEWGNDGMSNTAFILPVDTHLHTPKVRLTLSILSRLMVGHRGAYLTPSFGGVGGAYGMDYATHGDIGWIRIAALCPRSHDDTIIPTIFDALNDISQGGLDEDVFSDAKSAVRFSLNCDLNTPEEWNHLALNVMMDDDIFPWPDKVISDLEAIDRMDVCNLVHEILSSNRIHTHTIRE